MEVDTWCEIDHIRHFLYKSIYECLSSLPWENRKYDVLDFGSMWYGDPDGGWQTYMRWILKKLVGTHNVNHILGIYPEYNIENLHQLANNSMDFVVADQTLEHVQKPWLAAPEIHRVLKPGHLAMVATPGLYPIHPSPLDCWRIMPNGYEVLFPKSHWDWLLFDMWGNSDRVGYEYTNNKAILLGAPTYTVSEAMEQPFFTEGNDGKCPMQLWWIGRKK